MGHLLDVKDLVTTFRSDGKEFNAIEGVSLHVDRGEIVGIVLPQCSIGTLIEDGFNNITTLSYQIMPPIIVLALLMLGFNFIGDGLREALAPKLEDM